MYYSKNSELKISLLLVNIIVNIKHQKSLPKLTFRQNLRDIRAFSWSTPTLVTLLQRI